MKNTLLFVIYITLNFSYFTQNENNRGYKVNIGDQLPQLKMEMRNGEIWSNNNLKDKVVVLQFTGSWCSVCRKEMPELEKQVWQKFKNKDFLLIGIDTKETKEKVDLFIKKMEITYPVAYDPNGKIFSDFTLEGAGVTRNIVVNKKGEIVFLTRLYEEKEFNSMIKKIESLLN